MCSVMPGMGLTCHLVPRCGVMQVPIIAFHPIFAKYLLLARDCHPDAETLMFTKKLVETAKWYFQHEVDDYIPIMTRVFSEYLEAACLNSIGNGKLATDFSMQVMCLMFGSYFCFCKTMLTWLCRSTDILRPCCCRLHCHLPTRKLVCGVCFAK